MGRNFLQRLIVILIGLGLAAGASAAVYKYVGPDGQVTYSDRPQQGAKEVELPPLAPAAPPPASTFTPPATTFAPATSGEEKPTVYTKLDIVKPANDEAVRENSGALEINLAIEPQLDTKAGHTVTILLDGKPVLEGQTTPRVQLTNVDRGTHSLQAQIIDAKGAMLASSGGITFHMKRISTLFNSPLGSPALSVPSAAPFSKP
ncbi:MAG: DUF4124 domain-containing protein [Pseudomonadota bacterium]